MTTRSIHALAIATACAFLVVSCGSDDSKSASWTTEEPTFNNLNNTEPEPDPEPVLDPEPSEPEFAVGESCTANSDCAGGACITGGDWSDGYCTLPCDGGCPDASVCIASQNQCAASCQNDDECRPGYACDAQGVDGSKVCIPPRGSADGEACGSDIECQGGTCSNFFDPEGYCTTLGCQTSDDCSRQGEDNRCLQNQNGPNYCVRICDPLADVNPCDREGYACQRISRSEGICLPNSNPSLESPPIDPSVLANNPLDIMCAPTVDGALEIPYTISADTTAYMITPFTKSGEVLTPETITGPSGRNRSIAESFLSTPSRIYGGMNPTVVPAAPRLADMLEAGDHTYTVRSDAAEVCWYVLEEDQPGNSIDLNIYLVGVPGIDETNAESSPEMQAVISAFDTIYAQAGIRLGEVRYFGVAPDIATQYAIIRDYDALSTLVSQTVRPGTTKDEVLSANLFFVRGLALGGAIGVSLGLPGPAGLHGTHASGVVFTAEYMGTTTQDGFGNSVDGNVFTAQVLAHEVGHYLGLFHTSERTGRIHDPLDDTPECTRVGINCPAVGNLMFPFAASVNSAVSPDQGFVLGSNPLTKFNPNISTDPTDPTDPDEPDPNMDGTGATDGTMTGGN